MELKEVEIEINKEELHTLHGITMKLLREKIQNKYKIERGRFRISKKITEYRDEEAQKITYQLEIEIE